METKTTITSESTIGRMTVIETYIDGKFVYAEISAKDGGNMLRLRYLRSKDLLDLSALIAGVAK
jgi:hypothetical protein